MAEDVALENVLATKLDVKAARFGANREALRILMAALRAEEDEIRLVPIRTRFRTAAARN